MNLNRSRSLFDYEEDEGVSAPLRTFVRNSDDNQSISSRTYSYTIPRRSSRRSAYSFRDPHKADLNTQNSDAIAGKPLRHEVRDVSNHSSRNLVSQNKMFSREDSLSRELFSQSRSFQDNPIPQGRVWSKDDMYTRETNLGKRLHLNSRSITPTRMERDQYDEDQTIRITNTSKNKLALNSNDADAEPYSIPAMKCGPRRNVQSRRITSTPSVKTPLTHVTTQSRNDPEVDFSIEIRLKEIKKNRAKAKLMALLASDIKNKKKVSPANRGRSREVRVDGKDITPQKLFSRSQAVKCNDKQEPTKTPESKGKALLRSLSVGRDKKGSSQTDDLHGMTPSHMKRLAMKLASFRRGKSQTRSDETKSIAAETSPRSVLDATEVLPEKSNAYQEVPKVGLCNFGFCLSGFDFFMDDNFGEENKQLHEDGSLFSETHV